jgi:integrase/recombinase XerD
LLDFLHMIEVTRGNHVSTRNQRLAALHTFYRYVGLQCPEMLAEAQRVEAIPLKRTAPPQTDYLEHDEIETLFKSLPRQGILSLRDRAISMILYNTGARVQEIADLHIADVDLDGPLRIRLHGKSALMYASSCSDSLVLSVWMKVPVAVIARTTHRVDARNAMCKRHGRKDTSKL